MSEVYNPESEQYRELESLEVEARDLARRRNSAKSPQEREVLAKQLSETEKRIEALKRQLKP